MAYSRFLTGRRASCLLVIIVGFIKIGSVAAESVASADFSVGYGFTNHTGRDAWDTSETAAMNKNPGKDFRLDIKVEGGGFSKFGPSFKDRILQAPTPTGMSGNVARFKVVVTGVYTGPTPSDAATEPNYRLRLDIRKISIHAAAFDESSGCTLNFTEQSEGFEQSQDPQSLDAKASGFRILNNYHDIAWEPKAPEVNAEGNAQTRVFALSESVVGGAVLDGLEISGNIILEYDRKQ